MSLHFQIFCALCVCLTSVSKGAEFGFTSQLTYCFQQGNDKTAVTDASISMMGMSYENEKLNHASNVLINFRWNLNSWLHDWISCWGMDITACWEKNYFDCIKFWLICYLVNIGISKRGSRNHHLGPLLIGFLFCSCWCMCR